MYLAGNFEEWQASQNRRNFERKFVVSLIQLPQKHQWLFVGAYDSLGCREEPNKGHPERVIYDLRARESTSELEGRLVVNFHRTGRASYRVGENWDDAMTVGEIRPEKLTIEEFPGYSWVMLTKQRLDIVVQQQVASWKAALANVAGVYVIADRASGKLYVGSATGDEGIWSRWCAYSQTGHGGNRELRRLLRDKGIAYAENFQFGVLEIADTHASDDDVLQRESRWKELLLTRDHGYNAN